MSPEEMLQRLLYRDALMLVIDKPAGLPVHKGSGGGETLEQYFEYLRFGLPNPPALAHRLDRETSGCLVLGRHRQALQRLGKLFEQGKIVKHYWAIVNDAPPQTAGTIDLPLSKESPHRTRWKMKIADAEGMPARTDYKVMGSASGLTWVELMPHTGRTHQLRVHCAAIGCPIIGDKMYGKAPSHVPLQLHARTIEIPLYPKKDAIKVTAPIPEHMREYLQRCGFIAKD